MTKVGYCWLRSESHRYTWQMHIWEKILCSWACAAYCQNCEPNSHALRAQTVVLRSDAMRAHSRIFKQMLILSCAPAAFYVIGNKKCRSKPISSFHAGGGLYLSTAFFMWHIQYSRKGSSMYNKQFSYRRGIILKYGIFMWHIQYSRKGSSMYNKHSVGNFVHFVSIAGRLEALFERTQWASLPETYLIGGGAKWTKLPWMRLYMEEPFRTLLN